MKKQELKRKLLNHILKSGKKQISEKLLIKSFKLIQKSQKKSHSNLIQLSVSNSTPMFRVIQLKNKNRKKKSTTEIPAFLSNYIYRTSWALKYLIKTSASNTRDAFFKQLKHEILSNAISEGNAVVFKNELQSRALLKRKYFKHYRW